MLECSFDQWRAEGIEPVVLGMADGAHAFGGALREAGYDVRILPPLRSLRGLAALRRTLAALRPEIVHVHSETCFDLAALVAGAIPGIEGIVRTVHSNFDFTGSLRLRRTLRVRLARRHVGVAWVACSREVAATERSYERQPAEVVENWTDVARIRSESTEVAGREVRLRLRIPREAPVVALIGGCGYPKNHELVPPALAGASPCHVLHAGSTARQSPAEAAAWAGLAGRHVVHHLGERGDVPVLLAASDLVLLPSLYEGFPLAAIEALCAGVPILAADVVGLRWLGGMRAATLVPPELQAWSPALREALTDRGARRRLARADVEAARTRFTPERGVSEYAAIYRSCGC